MNHTDFGFNAANAPGMSPRIAEVAIAVGAALIGAAPLPIGLPDVNVRRHTLYHIKPIDNTLQQVFFNANQTKFVTNMKQGGALQNENVFWVTGVRFGLLWDTSATDVYTTTQLEGIRQVISWPEITFKVGDREVIQQVRGLQNFPAGSGIDASIMTAVPAAAGAQSFSGVFNNGVPVAQNKADFVPFAIVPQKPVVLTLDYQAAPNAKLANFTYNGAANTLAVVAYIDGINITPANY